MSQVNSHAFHFRRTDPLCYPIPGQRHQQRECLYEEVASAILMQGELSMVANHPSAPTFSNTVSALQVQQARRLVERASLQSIFDRKLILNCTASSDLREDPLLTLAEHAAMLYCLYVELPFSDQESIISQVAHHLRDRLEEKKTLHKQCLQDKSLRRAIPKGVTHQLLKTFAEIYYPGDLSVGAKALIWVLLIKHQFSLYLTVEHTQHILDVLTQDFDHELKPFIFIDASCHPLIEASLNLTCHTVIRQVHIKQALLLALFSCMRQFEEPNCFLIAPTLVAMRHNPDMFLKQLKTFLHRPYCLSDTLMIPYLLSQPVHISSQHSPELGTKEIIITALPAIKEICTALNCPVSASIPCDSTLYDALLICVGEKNIHAVCTRLSAFKRNPLLDYFINCLMILDLNVNKGSKNKQILTALQTLIKKNMLDTLNNFSMHIPSTLINVVVEQLILVPKPPQTSLDPRSMRLILGKTSPCILYYIASDRSYPLYNLSHIAMTLAKELEALCHKHGVFINPTTLRSFKISLNHELRKTLTQFSEENDKDHVIKATSLKQINRFFVPRHGGNPEFCFQGMGVNYESQEMSDTHHTLIDRLHALNVLVHRAFHVDHRSGLIVVSSDEHAYTMYLTKDSPITLEPKLWQKELKQMIDRGRQSLEALASKKIRNEMIYYCYPQVEDAMTILSRCKRCQDQTIGDFIDYLIDCVDAIDRERVEQRINQYLMCFTLQDLNLEGMLHKLKVSCDIELIRGLLTRKLTPFRIFPYQFTDVFKKTLFSKGCHLGSFEINAALKEHCPVYQPFVEIGNLNYVSHETENPKHCYLIVQFHFIKKGLCFYLSNKYETHKCSFELDSCELFL